MSTQDCLVQVEHVAKQYSSGGNASPVTVLSDVSLILNGGDSVAITGPSGSGKSTLLNIIGGLDTPSSGRVLIEQQNISDMKEKELALLRSQSIGFVFQLHHLLPQLTVLENVLVPTLAKTSGSRNSAREDAERARDLIDQVGLSERLMHRPGQLSGGECQRVALVRSLINRPGILLADEPTGALDRASAESLVELLVKLNETENVALILVSHAMDLALRMKKVMKLGDGILSPLKGSFKNEQTPAPRKGAR